SPTCTPSSSTSRSFSSRYRRLVEVLSRSRLSTTPTPAHSKVLARKELVRRSSALRAAGRTLVLTNGCFDLLHVGHVRYLEEARGVGDALVVGVNSDCSVCRLKGPGRPLVSQDERAEVVAALAAVDWVVLFDEDTALELVRDTRPGVYVKGG